MTRVAKNIVGAVFKALLWPAIFENSDISISAGAGDCCCTGPGWIASVGFSSNAGSELTFNKIRT